MTKSKEYIKKELKKFVKQFPQVKIRYEFHEMANTHFVEVLPYEVYSAHPGYILWENGMRAEFIKRYPAEGICFISDDTTVKVENAELTLCGADYAQFSTKMDAA
jgi:hypothetical protein